MRRAAIAIAAVLLGATVPAGAQPRRGSAAGPIDRRPGAAAADRREQIKKKIRALRAYTLTEELSLDEATASRLFPVLARYDDETDKLLERRIEVQRRLRRSDARDPRGADRLIDEAVAIQRGLWDLEDKKIAELRKILTPAQTARLLVVLPALDRKIQNQLRKAIVQRRGGALGSGATLDDGDDDTEPDEAPPPPPPRRREGPLAPRARPSNAPGNTPPCDPSAGPCH